jgi:hypothetical protein
MADYEVQYDKSDDQWKATRDGAKRAGAVADTQAEAIADANDLAANSGGGEVRIHRKDNNEIRDSNTIGKPDPFPPKG